MKKIVLGVSAVALALVLGVSVVGAQTAVTTTTTTSTAAFTRDLTIGSTGADVTALQAMLIANGKLMIAVPTGYFGAMTKTALASWQASVGITPAAGYFGPVTRAYLASHSTTSTTTSTVPGCTAGAAFSATTGKSCTTVTTTTSTNDDDEDEDDNDDDSELGGGEASLEDLSFNDGDDDEVEEGDKAEVGEIEFDVEDGDVEISRLDLSFNVSAGAGEEDEPWETFKKVTLKDEDGDTLASEDVSDEDDWLENDDAPYEFRFNDLDYVVREGDTAKITVEVEAQDDVDGADSDIAWTIFVDEEGIRGTDGEDIEQYIGDDDESVTFDVVEEGEGEELSVNSSDEDPDATTFQVEDDGRSDWFTVFAFELESEESDIEINDLPITFNTPGDRVADVINDLEIEIDGKKFDDYGAFSSTTGAIASTTFDIDGDFTVKKDDTVTVKVMARFNTASTSTTYPEGQTIQASVVGSTIDAEGADDITPEGSVTGETHTLSSAGIDVDLVDTDADATGENDTIGAFTFQVDVEAFEDDQFVELTANRGTTTTTSGFNVLILDGNNAVVATGTATFSVDADEDEEANNRVRVEEGDTVKFTVQVFFDAVSSGSYKAQLSSVNFNDSNNDGDDSFDLNPASEYRTSAVFVNAN